MSGVSQVVPFLKRKRNKKNTLIFLFCKEISLSCLKLILLLRSATCLHVLTEIKILKKVSFPDLHLPHDNTNGLGETLNYNELRQTGSVGL